MKSALRRRTAAGWRQALRDGLSILGVVVFVGSLPFLRTALGVDAHAYWGFDAAHPYTGAAGVHDAFVYAPPAAIALLPLHELPWPVFQTLLLAANLGVLFLMARGWAFALLGVLPVTVELVYGNVDLLIAAAVVAGFRYPAAWSFVLLTKVTPGVGLLWFAVRREWHALALAVAAAGGFVGLSFVIAPGYWGEWLHTLSSSSSTSHPREVDVALWARMAPAALLVIWGGLTNRRWTVPLAATRAMPVLWLPALSAAVGVVPLLRERQSRGDVTAPSRRAPVLAIE